jgi:glycosyltransferase involved in cell wall biosynthesis
LGDQEQPPPSKNLSNEHDLPLLTVRNRKSICFVSETGRIDNPLKDPSVRYRCYHPAEALLADGHHCVVTSAARFFENPTFSHDVYVFHRPNSARINFDRLLGALRKMGATLVADYDDLIFGDEKLALVSSAVKNGKLTEAQAINAFASNLVALQQFDKVTVSTEPLVARVKEHNPGSETLYAPNVIPPSILAVHKENRTPFLRRPNTSIGYFAGTHSHDKDFPVVEEALYRVLSERPDFHFLVVGPVAVPRSLAALPNVGTAPVVNFLRLPGLMTMCSTVIAPLEETDFNACKSRVKFLEAALGGCRLVASPIPDMRVIGPQHLTLAESINDWYEVLSQPLNTEERHHLAQRNFDLLEHTAFNASLKHLTGIK